jgi:hypothetical protein
MEMFHQGAFQRAARAAALPRASVLRAALLAGCTVAVGFAAWAGDPAPYLLADPALARLLRAMAVIKGVLALAAALAAWWRFGWRVSPGVSIAYLAAASALSGAAMLIWQLTWIPFAAVLFHAALIGLLLAAWRDDRGSPSRARLAVR